MSWNFAGIIFEKNYQNQYPDLLTDLKVNFQQSGEGFTFDQAIRYDNQASALRIVNQKTLFLNHLLPYNCSYEPKEDLYLDKILTILSSEGDILNFIVNERADMYCFSLFSQQKRIRRWAIYPEGIMVDEGEKLNVEKAEISNQDQDVHPEELPVLYHMSASETQLFRVFASFLGLTFQELVRDKNPRFHFFL